MKKYHFDLPSLANVEIEDKEVVRLADSRLFKIEGKTHDQGGENVYLPNNTLIYSHHLKLDKEVASEILDKKVKKKMSPADLSKKFDTTEYISILEDPTKRYDDMAKKTAALMLTKMNAIQDNIFIAQESDKHSRGMKSEVSPKQDLPQAKYGKLHKMNHGGPHDPPLGKDYIGKGFLSYNPGFSDLLLRGFHEAPAGDYGRQRKTGDDLYGGVPAYRKEHTDWLKYYYDKDISGRNFQDSYADYVKSQFGVEADFSAQDDVNRDYKYGNITREAPLGYTQIQGKKSGRFTLSDYNANPEKIQEEFGLSDAAIRQQLAETKAYYVDVDSFNTNPVNLPSADLVSLKEPTIPPLSTDIQEVKETLNKYDEDFYDFKEEKPVGIDSQQLIHGVQQGLLASQLATLSKENPYYTKTKTIAPVTRFEPINTKQQERAFNMSREAIENSNMPEQVKQAQLANINSRMVEGVNQIDLTNYQGNLENINRNNVNITNTVNQNAQEQTRANYQYMQERARANELFYQQKNNIVSNMLNLWKDTQQNRDQIKLVNQLADNYNFDTRTGQVEYQRGSGTPLITNPLDHYMQTQAQLYNKQ